MPPAPKPVLTLVGVVWDKGRDPSALIDGLPGVDGPRPVRRGDVLPERDALYQRPLRCRLVHEQSRLP